MKKTGEENKSSTKSLDIKNIIIALMSVLLTLSLLFNFLILGRLSNIQDNLNCEGLQDGLFHQMNSTLDKIRHLRQQVIDREVIKEDDIIGVPIDNQLKEDIKEYNKLVSMLRGFFSEMAIETIIAVLEPRNEDGEIYAPDTRNYLELPSEVKEYTEIIADLSLYRDCTELLCNHPRLAYIISHEGGGSYGLWPYLWHTEYLREQDYIRESLNRLFELVEKIITSLDNEYEQLRQGDRNLVCP